MLTRAKSATVLVHVPSQGKWGSAFCIDDSGLLLTSDDAVRELAVGAQVSIVVNAGNFGERTATATLERIDPSVGVALLSADADAGLLPLQLGDDQLIEEARLTTIGFPAVDDHEIGVGLYPAAQARPGIATALHRSEGSLVSIQFNGVLQAGSAGGPVLNTDGKAVGVIYPGAADQGSNSFIPVSRLKQLQWPELDLAAAGKHNRIFDAPFEDFTALPLRGKR
jgi:S1-C subfamily serine protease